VTVLDLKPNPQNMSALYLENIYQLLANDANAYRSSVTVAPPKPPTFSPPNYVILANSLWFSSLVISLTSAMLATMLQQSARRYLRITQKPMYRDSPHNGARIRAFFANGVEKSHFPLMAEVIPALIHISLFLFFGGLLVYLHHINQVVFLVTFGCIMASATTYLVITLRPILSLNSPYYAPLSSLTFRVFSGMLWVVFSSLRYLACCCSIASNNFFRLGTLHRERFLRGMEKTAENFVRESSVKMDGDILKSTFDAHALAPVDQMDQLFKNILSFYGSDDSEIVQDTQSTFESLRSEKFSSDLVAFWNRTRSSHLASDSESDIIRQFVMCVKVADATGVTASSLEHLVTKTKDHDLFRTVEVGHFLRNRGNNNDREIGLCAQIIVADIIANVRGTDDHWITLAVDQLGKSEDAIRRYLAHGNDNRDVLLANWIYITRQILMSSSDINQDMAGDAAYYVLRPLSDLNFDIQGTLPELQHELCDFWNETLPNAQKSKDGSVPHCILFLLRKLYISLHEGTDDAPRASFDKFKVSTYPSCKNPDHRSRETVGAPVPPLDPDPTSSQPPNPSSSGGTPDPLQPTTPQSPDP
jgi:Family of unknown function (DUF6535)